MKVHRINEMKIKNINTINFIAGLIGIGSTREFCSAPNGQVDVKHEISQFKGSKQHGCSEVFFQPQEHRENWRYLDSGGMERKLEFAKLTILKMD